MRLNSSILPVPEAGHGVVCANHIAMGDPVASQIATIMLINHIIYREISFICSLRYRGYFISYLYIFSTKNTEEQRFDGLTCGEGNFFCELMKNENILLLLFWFVF
ncbi:hypothetical protein [Dickeya zeae]|uniref:Uncharacterized protein n=1 Tax=Dickeya zeae TaxID=204042 RepID=A0ABX8W235_9GAMM|nr:hypothetical protein [Dickeya zeae]MCO7260374.1 hypothetical protein [Dickeya zeae]QYM94075.1 hypothetical protein FGI21_20535 [Dickeya zeae]